MVEEVEGFSSELCLDSLSEFEALGDGQVHVVETGVTKDVATHGAKLASSVRDQHGTADHIAVPRRPCERRGKADSSESRSCHWANTSRRSQASLGNGSRARRAGP